MGGDLDAIVFKALRKNPDERYASASEFADDVRRHLTGHPVRARRQTFGYLARRFVHRNRLPLAAAAGITREIRGGKVRGSIDINGRGTTPHRVASTMSGTIVVVSGPATLGRVTTQGESAASQVAGALDPFHTVDAVTELHCAVFRLPLANGIANVDRSIAIETGKIDGSASGTVDFRDETLDLSVQPQVRAGVKLDVSQLAGLVRIRGRFDKPAVAIDAAQSAQLIARLGVLGAKGGGLAELGRALIAPQGESTGSPCAIAERGGAARASAPAPAAQPRSTDTPLQKALPKDIGNALGKLLGR